MSLSSYDPQNEEEIVQSRWQPYYNRHSDKVALKRRLALYHNQKSQYYKAMANAYPWGWWYRTKAMHHRMKALQQERRHRQHELKKQKYMLKMHKNGLKHKEMQFRETDRGLY